MKKTVAMLLVLVFAIGLGVNCGAKSQRQKISMWFWGAPPEHQQTMKKVLVEPYNKSQTRYELTVEFRNTVDKDITVALSANQGPDIVYGSGAAFVAPYAEAGKLECLDTYSRKYGWKNRILAPIYQSSTVNGKLYSLPNSLNTMGIFYNKVVLKENGWEPPKTIAELEKIMDAALKKGMYASVTGNKGWKPVNENYVSLFLTHMAGPENVYKCLKGEQPWNSPAIAAAINKSAEWYKKGYLAGNDYVNLNFADAVQLLADKKTPFFIGPTLVFQFASTFFKGDKEDDLGFIPFPSVNPDLEYPLYTLGTTATLSINANSKHKAAAAAIINQMMTPKFLVDMTSKWPGYWGVPLKTITADTHNLKGLSAEYIKAIKDMMNAVNNGRFGYYVSTFFPPQTQQDFIDVDTVWFGTTTTKEMLQKIDEDFAKEKAKGLVAPIPKPGK